MSNEANGAPRTVVDGERTIYDSPWVRLVQLKVTPPDGREFWHHVVRLQTVATAVVINNDEQVLMVWRHRFVPDEFGWELPGGIVEAGEDAAATAARETEEETGWRPSEAMQHVITFQPMPGMVDTPHTIYAATGAAYIGPPTDREEAGIVEWISLANIPELIRDGKVAGAGSLVALLHILALGR